MVKAVIDVGSNSVLLLLAERRGSSWHTLAETTAVTALGEGTRTSGLLSERAMRDTLAALRDAYSLARDAGAESIVAGVTMAGRLARNTPSFIGRAEAQNTPIFVLPGEEEAQLGFLAVAEDPIFAGEHRITIVDVGGHSTELVTANMTCEGWRVRFRRSFPIGTLGLRETTLSAEAPDFEARVRAVKQIDDAVGLIYLPSSKGHAVSLGATGTNLVSIREGMTEWQPERVHGAVLDYEEISRAVGWLCGMTDAQRAAVRGIEKGREKTLHIGALILERFLHAVKATECRVSVHGWRHALLDHDLPLEGMQAVGDESG